MSSERECFRDAEGRCVVEFEDGVLGKCRFDLDGFYVTNEMYGGYSYHCTGGMASAEYVDPSKVLGIAADLNAKVHLAGDVWPLINRKGWGEVVSVEDAKAAVQELQKLRSNWTFLSEARRIQREGQLDATR
jgi:hypothetical protein